MRQKGGKQKEAPWSEAQNNRGQVFSPFDLSKRPHIKVPY